MGDVEPAMDEDWMDRLGQVVIGAVIAGGVVVTLGMVADMAQPTMGATRSARLEWERRQAEVQQAVEQADGAEGVAEGVADRA
jgi:hypothetical protein